MLEIAIKDRLAGLAGGRVFAGAAPDTATSPHLFFSVVGQPYSWTLAGPDGSGPITVQVTCRGTDYSEIASIADTVFSAMTAEGEDFYTTGAQRRADSYDKETALLSISWEFILQP